MNCLIHGAFFKKSATGILVLQKKTFCGRKNLHLCASKQEPNTLEKDSLKVQYLLFFK